MMQGWLSSIASYPSVLHTHSTRLTTTWTWPASSWTMVCTGAHLFSFSSITACASLPPTTHSLAVKDMAGLLKPKAAEMLISALRREFPDTVLHVHTHDSAATGVACQLAAAAAGADMIDCCIDAMSGTTSQPAMGAVVHSLRGTQYDTGIDPASVTGALGKIRTKLLLLFLPLLLHWPPVKHTPPFSRSAGRVLGADAPPVLPL